MLLQLFFLPESGTAVSRTLGCLVYSFLHRLSRPCRPLRLQIFLPYPTPPHRLQPASPCKRAREFDLGRCLGGSWGQRLRRIGSGAPSKTLHNTPADPVRRLYPVVQHGCLLTLLYVSVLLHLSRCQINRGSAQSAKKWPSAATVGAVATAGTVPMAETFGTVNINASCLGGSQSRSPAQCFPVFEGGRELSPYFSTLGLDLHFFYTHTVNVRFPVLRAFRIVSQVCEIPDNLA